MLMMILVWVWVSALSDKFDQVLLMLFWGGSRWSINLMMWLLIQSDSWCREGVLVAASWRAVYLRWSKLQLESRVKPCDHWIALSDLIIWMWWAWLPVSVRRQSFLFLTKLLLVRLYIRSDVSVLLQKMPKHSIHLFSPLNNLHLWIASHLTNFFLQSLNRLDVMWLELGKVGCDKFVGDAKILSKFIVKGLSTDLNAYA